MTRFLLTLIGAAALSACAPMHDAAPGPDPLTTAAVGLATDAAPLVWPDQQWWQRYGDAQLNALVTAALADNPDMAVAEARLRQAQAATDGAGASLLPSANGSFRVTRQHYSNTYVYPEPLGGSVGSDARLAIDVQYELDLWHKHRSGLQAAQSRTEAARAEQQWARNLLVLAVVQSYADLQDAYAQQEVLRQSLTRADEVLALTRDRFAAGLDTQVEVHQAEAMRAEAQVQERRVAADIARQTHRLAALRGAGPQTAPALQPVALRVPTQPLPTHLPLELLGHRPDIVAARWQAEAAGAEIDVAKARFYPDVNITAFVGMLTLNTALLFDQASRMAGIAPAISLPLFDAGRLNAGLDDARARRDQAVAQYNQAVLDGVREVADALDGIRLLAEEAQHQQVARDATQAAYTLARDRYQAGLGNYLTVLTAQASVLEQQRQDTALAARAYRLDASLATALGGGYEPPSVSPIAQPSAPPAPG